MNNQRYWVRSAEWFHGFLSPAERCKFLEETKNYSGEDQNEWLPTNHPPIGIAEDRLIENGEGENKNPVISVWMGESTGIKRVEKD